jgi:flagellar biosynthesis/type III secretory pathway protein FliH
LNPADHAALREQAVALAAHLNPVGVCRVVADPAITAGGCKATTEFGVVDMQLETQLDRLGEEWHP